MTTEIMKSTFWPKAMIERYKSQPTDPQESTWECPKHGTIEPKGYEIDGIVHYVRRFCACSESERRRKEEERQRKEHIENMAKHTYSWLGERWADTSLRKKTFESFDAGRQLEAYELTKLYADNPQGTLVLYGTFGTGKTHLLAAICNESLHKHGKSSVDSHNSIRKWIR